MTPPPAATPESGRAIACPFCASAETELFAMFGQSLLASPYYCRRCKTVFEVVRWEEPLQSTSPEEGQAQRGGAGDEAG
jgi:hypothetical protein